MDNDVFIGAVVFLCVFAVCMTMYCRKKSSGTTDDDEQISPPIIFSRNLPIHLHRIIIDGEEMHRRH